MLQNVSDGAFARAVQQAGVVSYDQIEAAKAAQAESAAKGVLVSLADMLLQQGVMTPAIRGNIEKKVRAQQQGGIQQFGQFKLLKKLGEGGMGAVYLAEDTNAGRQVAIKLLPKKHAGDADFLSRFRREARAAGQLNHVNIAGAHTVGEEMGYHYLVMEYVDGEPLDKTLKGGGALKWDKALEIVMQVARGLSHAHEHGIVHRDIKPGNIIVTPKGVAKILDLGLSKNLGGEEQFHTQTGVAVGTPHYVSPEQARGDKSIDGRTDIYSLGATFYHLVTGQTPFQGSTAAVIMTKHLNEQLPNPQDINPDIPDGVAHVITRMMAKEPKDRYRDCTELLADLELVIDGKTPASHAIEVGKSSVAMRLPSRERKGAVPLPHAPAPAPAAQGARKHEHEAQLGRLRHGATAGQVRSGTPVGMYVTIGVAVLGALALILVLNSGGSRDRDEREARAAAEKQKADEAARWADEQRQAEEARLAAEAAARKNAEEAAKMQAVTAPVATTNPPPTLTLDLGEDVKVELVLVKAGEFDMGERGVAEPVHHVKITKPFYIGKYPVTVAQFAAFVNATKYQTDCEKGGNKGWSVKDGRWAERTGMNWRSPGFEQTPDHPVVLVSWNDTQAFAAWASRQTRRDARLPSEAQWEYAARGPESLGYPFGEWDGVKVNHCDAALKNSGFQGAAYSKDNDGYAYTSPMGKFNNASWCGAFDMSGNVWQWVQDWEADYSGEAQVDPQGPANGQRHVLRGGSWANLPVNCRAAYRERYHRPGNRNDNHGFRVVVALGPEARPATAQAANVVQPDAKPAETPSAKADPRSTGATPAASVADNPVTYALKNWGPEELHGKKVWGGEFGGRKSTAIWARPTLYNTFSGTFQLAAGRYGPGEFVVLSFLQKSQPCLLSIWLNGQSIYNGRDKATQQARWTEQRYSFAAGILRSGRNDFIICNMEPQGKVDEEPWYMLNSVEIRGAQLPDSAPNVSGAHPSAPPALERVFDLLAKADVSVGTKIEQAAKLVKDANQAGTEPLAALLERAGAAHARALKNLSDNPPKEPVQIEKLKLTGAIARIAGGKAYIKSQGLEMPVDVALLPPVVLVKALGVETTPQALADKAAYLVALGDRDAGKDILKLLKPADRPAWADLVEQASASTPPETKALKPEPRLLKPEAKPLPKEMSLDLGGVRMDLVLVPAGEFMMGEKGVAEPLHPVKISKPFYMGRYEVTQEQYETAMGNNPSKFKGLKNPVDSVTWPDAQEFCRKLSAKTGKTVQLPTEAQWEYACRAGTTTRFCSGDADDDLDGVAWYKSIQGNTTHPVGQNKPNKWGLYDMHGNVWEWCADWVGGYTTDAPTDPTGAATGGYRVLRGGAYHCSAKDCRSAFRLGSPPGYHSPNSDFGFRVVVVAQSRTEAPIQPPAPTPTPAIPANLPKDLALDLGGAVKMDLVLVNAGEFNMGTEDGHIEENPVHKVKISQLYYIGKYDVTVAQFRAFAEAMRYQTEAEKCGRGWTVNGKDWQEQNGINWKNPGFKQEDNHPVVVVTWDDAQDFCKWATERTAAISAAPGAGGMPAVRKWTVRLPTEAEWEYAARGAKSSEFPWGDKWDEKEIKANVADASLRRAGFGMNWGEIKEDDDYPFTSPAGAFKNVSWCGAFDMAGNVWQWCQDYWNDKYYADSPAVDPQGPATGGTHVVRGGCWVFGPTFCRSARRFGGFPVGRYAYVGFRVVVGCGSSMTEAPIQPPAPSQKTETAALPNETARSLAPVGKTTRTETVGGAGGGEFEDVSSALSPLVGLKISWKGGTGDIIDSIQPVFLTGAGKVTGQVHGATKGQIWEVVAKPDYAVAALIVKGSQRVHGLRIVFRPITPRLPAIDDKYTSEWFGGLGGDNEVTIGSDRSLAVGLHGRQGTDLDAIGLVLAAQPASQVRQSPATTVRPANAHPGERGLQPNLILDLGPFAKMEMVLLPEGEFNMGSNDGPGEEQPVHKVRISKPFYMGKYHVTVGQFQAFVEATKYQTEAEKAGNKG